MITFLAVFISLSLIIFFHELGHLISSKLFKIKVEEFGFGFPPRLFGLVRSKKNKKWLLVKGKTLPPEQDREGTIYSVNLIPFGGFNKIKGEEVRDEQPVNEPDSFLSRVWWQKGIVVISGVLMNFILAVILFCFGFSLGLPTSQENIAFAQFAKTKEIGVQIIGLEKKSPAELAGFKIGDIILEIDGQEIKEVEETRKYIQEKTGEEIQIDVKRGEVKLSLAVKPDPEKKIIGVVLAKTQIVSYPLPIALVRGFETTTIFAGQLIKGIYFLLKELIVSRKMVGEVAGVIGIATMIGEVSRIGFVYLLQFVAIISIAIAIFQLIPFPALDGGRLVFILIEGIRRKPINQKVETMIHNFGFTLLILLIIIVTYWDLMRLGEKIFPR